MSKCFNKILSCVCVLVILFSCAVPAFASAGEGGGGFSGGGGAGRRGTYYEWNPQYRDAVSYKEHIDSLPATVINSDGQLIYTPSLDYMAFYASWGYNYFALCPHTPDKEIPSDWRMTENDCSVDWLCDRNSFVVYPGTTASSSGRITVTGVRYKYTFNAPVSGTYRMLQSPASKASKVVIDGSSFSDTSYYRAESSFVYRAKGYTQSYTTELEQSDMFSSSAAYNLTSFVCILSAPQYLVIPSDGSVNIDVTFNINTRPTSYNLPIGYYDDNSVGIIAPNYVIVNETNNTYYNPVTNTTNNITDWTFNYITRQYDLTLDNDLKVSVSFGDDYISITEGDNEYKVYYVVEDDPCSHEYTEEITKAPTCIDAGTKTFTCSKCGSTYTQRIAATGHTWTVKETVKTEYGENGELVTQGYTLYECSTCGEQYKSTDGGKPPNPSEDDSDTGIIGWLKKIYNAILGLDLNIHFSDDENEDNESWLSNFIGKFGWLRSVYEIGQTFLDDVSTDAAAAYADSPQTNDALKITADLSAAQSNYGVTYGGGEVTVLDLSWYGQYKPTVDRLISGFLWLGFGWGLFKAAPSILSGAGIVLNKSEDISRGRKGD